jgi:hypothetical protein
MAVTPDPDEYTDEERLEEESLERRWRRGAATLMVAVAVVLGFLIVMFFLVSRRWPLGSGSHPLSL